ncbi:IRF3 factor, partial [Brachypteracias leptosomus]|nr:IRF3 factor [Brachypteracias leptosomus]
ARREAQKLRFVPWLVSAINSGIYPGLCWTSPARRAFRVPWKHNSRKDITSSDVEVFKVGGMGVTTCEVKVFKGWGVTRGGLEWKTNFRGALRSTRMFKLLEDHSKRGDDPHKVF